MLTGHGAEHFFTILPSENEKRVEAFLESRSDFSLLPAETAWAETIGEPPPGPSPFLGHCLLLTPARHGTDGFFAAVFERRKKA